MSCYVIGWLNRLGVCVLLLAVLAGYTSCGTSRKAARKPLKKEGTAFLLQKLAENEFVYETFSAKFNADYDDGKTSASLTGHLRMKNDSIIWLSLSPALGIEMMRIILTRDTVKILDRMQPAFLVEDYSYFNHWVKGMLDFDMLQSLIVGNDFKGFDHGSALAATEEDHYSLELRGRSNKKKNDPASGDSSVLIPFQHIRLSPETFKITYTAFREKSGDNRMAEATYREFKPAGSQEFPRQVTYVIREGTARLEFDIRYLRVTLNESLDFPFSIPERYIRAEK